MKTKKQEIIGVLIAIIIQTLIFIIIGFNKEYIHIDEAYSLGLSNYNKVEIQDNDDFYNNWHTGEYYEDYLAVQEKDIGQYWQVYENQKNDVHPPLYYLLLRIFMGFSINKFSMWPGIILNIIIYAFITIFMYLIAKKLFESKEKSLILTFASSIILASLNTVIYIRMYALSTLNILIATFLHIKLLDEEKINIKLLIAIGISTLVGALTHYYYLFYLVMIYIIFVIKYIKEKRFKDLIFYTATMFLAGITFLAIFPYSIKHVFWGYRGQEVMDNMTNISTFLKGISEYCKKVNYYCFSNMFIVLFAIIISVVILELCKRRKIKIKSNKYIKLILYPTIFYFLIVSIASPFVELRYIMPICGLIFILMLYIISKVLRLVINKKETNVVLGLIVLIILVMPTALNLEFETLYKDKKEIVEKLSSEMNLPTIYLFKSENNRFLDDIYLFSLLKESYIAKDIKIEEEAIKQILNEKDISKGIIIFINEGQDNDNILNIVKTSINANEITHLKHLNAADVYYLK